MSCDTSACITWHQCLYHVTPTSGLGEIGWVFLKVDYNYLTPLFTVEGAKTSEVSTHMLRHHYSATAHVTAYLNPEPNCIPSALLQNSAITHTCCSCTHMMHVYCSRDDHVTPIYYARDMHYYSHDMFLILYWELCFMLLIEVFLAFNLDRYTLFARLWYRRHARTHDALKMCAVLYFRRMSLYTSWRWCGLKRVPRSDLE